MRHAETQYLTFSPIRRMINVVCNSCDLSPSR